MRMHGGISVNFRVEVIVINSRVGRNEGLVPIDGNGR